MTKVGFWRSKEVDSFLRYVNASHTIYFERLGDNLFQGIAYQMFANRTQVYQHHDFAYEHITRKPVQMGNDNASIVMCMGYGGFALGINVSRQDSTAARSRLKEVIGEKIRQDKLAQKDRTFYSRCPRNVPCYVGDKYSNDAGLYMGSATAEQPMCGRHPQPYYCGHERELPTPSTNIQEALETRSTMRLRRSCRGAVGL